MRIFENANYDFLSDFRASYIVSGVAARRRARRRSSTPASRPASTSRAAPSSSSRRPARSPRPPPRRRSTRRGRRHRGQGVRRRHRAAVRIRTASGGDVDALRTRVEQTLASTFRRAPTPTIQGIDAVGPRFADDLQRGAFSCVLGALFVILLYIFVRFDWRYAVGAVLCLAHDVVIVLGLFALLHAVTPFTLQIDQTIIAALLTIVGYSINDTVVVFDRIREYALLFKTEPFATVANRAINSTLSRTIADVGHDADRGDGPVPHRRRGAPRLLARAAHRHRRRAPTRRSSWRPRSSSCCARSTRPPAAASSPAPSHSPPRADRQRGATLAWRARLPDSDGHHDFQPRRHHRAHARRRRPGRPRRLGPARRAPRRARRRPGPRRRGPRAACAT